MKKKAMALLMAVAMAAGMLAGCGGGTQTASGDAAGGAKTDENGAVEYTRMRTATNTRNLTT